MKKEKDKYITGIIKQINYNGKPTKIDVGLIIDKIGTPVIEISDEANGKKLLRLHIKESIEMKGIFDTLIVDYLEYLNEQKNK